MDRAFTRGYQSRVNRQPFVFRHQLLPLTLGHLFLLEAIESPLIGGTKPIEIADIGAAVFACSHPHDVAIRKLRSWTFGIYVRVWAWFANASWMVDDLRSFREYLSAGMDSPSIRPYQDGGRICQTPGPWIKLFFALHILHMTRSQAMDCTVVELNVLYATWAEWSGSGSLGDSEKISELWDHVQAEQSKQEAS